MGGGFVRSSMLKNGGLKEQKLQLIFKYRCLTVYVETNYVFLSLMDLGFEL